MVLKFDCRSARLTNDPITGIYTLSIEDLDEVKIPTYTSCEADILLWGIGKSEVLDFVASEHGDEMSEILRIDY
jgi:hypothetical protein